jgi:plasmid stabilization system protein ParE
MTYKVIILPAAETDLLQAQEWYESRLHGLGVEFLSSVEAVLRRIARAPYSHALQVLGVRAAMTHRFPYVMYYRIEEDRVIVFAILHSARDPNSWRRRAKGG